MNRFIPLPEPWLGEEHVVLAFLLGVAAGGTIGSLILPPARAVIDSVSTTPVPDGVIDDMVTSMIASIGGMPGE
jgi:predicted small lipoprotein YifL